MNLLHKLLFLLCLIAVLFVSVEAKAAKKPAAKPVKKGKPAPKRSRKDED